VLSLPCCWLLTLDGECGMVSFDGYKMLMPVSSHRRSFNNELNGFTFFLKKKVESLRVVLCTLSKTRVMFFGLKAFSLNLESKR